MESAQQWEAALGRLDVADNFGVRFLRARRMLAMFADLNSRDCDSLTSLVAALRTERPRWYPIVALAGACAEARQDAAEALREYQRAIELGDSRTVTLQRLVALLYRKGLYSEAQGHLSRLTTSASGRSDPRLDSLAIALAVKRNQMDEALALAKAAADRHPDDAMRQVWLGGLLASRGQRKEAERLLRQAVERFRGDQRVWDALFTFLVQTKQPDAARQVLQQLTDAVKMDDATRHAVLAQGHEMLGEHDAARQQYAAVLKIKPANTAIRLRLAKLLLSSDIGAATKQFERIVELDPNNDEAARQLATLLASSGSDADWKRAMRLLQQSQGAANTGSLLSNRLRAVLLTRRGRTRADRLRNLEAARRILLDQLNQSGVRVEDSDRLLLAGIFEKEALLQENPAQLQAARDQLRPLVDRANPPIKYLKLYVEFLLRHVQPAAAPATDTSVAQQIRSVFLDDARARLGQLQTAQQENGLPRDTPLSVSLEAQLLKADDRTDDAVTLVGQFAEKQAAALTDEPERARFYLSMGNLYASLSRPADAEVWYRKLMSIAPAAYWMVVRSLADQGRVEEATEVCFQVSKDQASPDAATTLAQLLTLHDEETKSAEDAQSLITTAVETHGENQQLLFGVAVLYLTRGQTDDAIRLFRRIVELAPNNVATLNNLATLLGERPNQHAEALEAIDRAIEIAGRQPALLDTLGTIFLLAGDAAQAVACLEESVAGGAVDSRYYLHLAAAYQKTDQIDKARDSLARARRYGLNDAMLTESDRQLRTQLEQTLPTAASRN
jgi:tetratricopeptide (TPR) repeat protein